MPEFSQTKPAQNRARVAVVAAGIVSPLGLGLDETLASLRAGRDCVTPVTIFPVENCRCQSAGQVPDDRLAACDARARHPQRLHRVATMMILALGEALTQT